MYVRKIPTTAPHTKSTPAVPTKCVGAPYSYVYIFNGRLAPSGDETQIHAQVHAPAGDGKCLRAALHKGCVIHVQTYSPGYPLLENAYIDQNQPK